MFFRRNDKTKGVAEGQQALDEGRYPDAIIIFNSILSKNPAEPYSRQGKLSALVAQARVYQAQHQLAAAEDYLSQAVQLQPDNLTHQQALAGLRQRLVQQRLKNTALPLSENKPSSGITNLVFQGGGIKGLAYLGALAAFSERVALDEIRRVGGTSAGAITATLLAVGCSVDELNHYLTALDFTEFLDGPFQDALLNSNQQKDGVQQQMEQIKSRWQLITNASAEPFSASYASGTVPSQVSQLPLGRLYDGLKQLTQHDIGLFPGDYFREQWLEKRLHEKTGIAYLTFAELQRLQLTHPDKGYKELFLVGVNLTTARTEVFSADTTPDLIISDAVRISMSIPFIFTPHYRYVKQAGQRIKDPLGHWYADGGLLDNYAPWLWDKADYLPCDTSPLSAHHNPHTLGFSLFSPDETEQSSPSVAAPDSLGDYAWRLVKALGGKEKSDHARGQNLDRTIAISNQGVDTLAFDLTPAHQQRLIASGREAVESFFAKRHELTQALWQAIRERHIRHFNQLLHQGASVQALTSVGESVLDLALHASSPLLIVKCLEKGVMQCQEPDRIWTVIEAALESDFVEKEQLILGAERFRQYHQLEAYPVNRLQPY